MVGLDGKQRELLADKAGDAANIAAGALVFSQFLTDSGPSPLLVIVGLTVSMFFVVISVLLARRQQP